MWEVIVQDTIPILSEGLARGVVIFIIAMGAVYLFGRMVGLVKTDKQKNTVAITTMLPATYLVMSYYQPELILLDSPIKFIYTFLIYLCFSILLYVLIGFKLYKRVDNLLDKKVAED
jgi:hypothetical protein